MNLPQHHSSLILAAVLVVREPNEKTANHTPGSERNWRSSNLPGKEPQAIELVLRVLATILVGVWYILVLSVRLSCLDAEKKADQKRYLLLDCVENARLDDACREPATVQHSLLTYYTIPCQEK